MNIFSNSENSSTQTDQEIEEWLRSSSENQKEYNSYQKIWKGITRLSLARKFKPEQAWQKVNRQLMDKEKQAYLVRRYRYVTTGMAASLLLVLAFTFYTRSFSFSDERMEVSTAPGSRSELKLPDGSMVKLNAGSSLYYAFNKVRKQREVHFRGEGFFEVAKSKHPFIIHSTDGMELKVLGTRFNLRSYPEDSETRTTLVEGKIELRNGSGQRILMAPGQVVSFNSKSKHMELIKVNPSHSYGWMEDKLYMDNMSLEEVCSRLERRYDVKISFKPSGFAEDMHYTGVLQEETVITVLDALCELSAIRYSIKGKEILIAKK